MHMHVAKLASIQACMLGGFQAICRPKLDLSTAAKMQRQLAIAYLRGYLVGSINSCSTHALGAKILCTSILYTFYMYAAAKF